MGLVRLIELGDLELESHPEYIKKQGNPWAWEKREKRLSYKQLMGTRDAKLEAAICLLVLRLIG